MARDSRRTVLSFMSDEAQQRSRENSSDTVHRLSLNDIRPDPGQPRHLLPPALATRLYSGDLPPLMVLKSLITESQTDKTLTGIVDGIAALAADIKENGLINPITIYKPEGRLTHYTIETGERRYWAHWYLVEQGEEAYRQIRALIVDDKNTRLRQLSENLRRDGLTAIETAIGLASFIAELQGNSSGSWYESDTLASPMLRRLTEERLKRGTWPQVIERLGYGRRHWHNYLNLLKLCDEALEIAHKNRLPEWQLRPVTAIKNPIEQIMAIHKLLIGDTLPDVAQAGEIQKNIPAKQAPPAMAWQRAVKNLHRKFRAENISSIRSAIRSDAEQHRLLTDVRDRINEILSEN